MPRQKSTHVDDPRLVGQRLKAARERAGLSQRQLSFSGCSPAYISRIESGDRIPSLQLLRELGRRLGVTEDFLATGEERHEANGGALEGAHVALLLNELDVAESLYRQALDDAVGNGLRSAAFAGLGQIAFRRGEPREAIALFEEARRLGCSDFAERAAVSEGLGRAYALVGELASAIGIFEGALAEAEAHDNEPEVIRFAVLLAYALIDSGNLGRAEELLGHALALGRDSSDPLVRAKLYWSQSRLHAERNDAETAASYARRALEVLRLTEDTYRTARAYQLLAYIELNRGNAQEAAALLAEGRPLLERSANSLERAQYQLEEARALVALGRREDAAGLAMQVAGLLADAAPEDAARSYTVLGQVYEELGEPSRAREVYELALELLRPGNPSRFLVDVYAKLAELCEKEGRKEEAYEFMKLAVGMKQAVAEQPRL